MSRSNRPGVDRAIVSPIATRDGQPISYSRAPAADLDRWIGRLYVTIVGTPPEHRLDCGLLSDFACIRIQLRGKWEATTADGVRTSQRAAMLFGPHSRRMPISVTGSFVSIGIFLRPGVCHALRGPEIATLTDRLATFAELEMPEQRWLDMFDPDGSPEDWVQAMECEMRSLIADRAVREPDPISARFEAAAFADPTVSIARLAENLGVTQRRLERIARRDFGMPPKQVLRRARALDMASHLRGVADHDEAESIALRYYDQSHLIREFTALFGMSPRQFVERPQPLMTLGLETRQARRLEEIRRLEPGEVKPWE
ncbi:AraC family transcriptional regulator [Novosphingobium sp. THN1]|jgi:AraC-like DNA-binding protein|uniref:helix-turn-helix transcriptional regulator n=1 Tax=unclassified Novosphingobium TaxID=2644732 RepID=UPI000E52357B|nr:MULTISPECIES: helix-turn-helix domain-containing protein [unclassified Novosphingobium]AXU17987.1 AraC family transcriptional regulator [Novosphingobium sp. THN1]NLR37741.1 helix-turn-helix domain-containing protein [Novosphingobium sp. ERW19]